MFPMFSGYYQHGLDEKFRVSVPSRFLTLLEAQGGVRSFWSIPGFDKCVLLYLHDDFMRIAEQVRARTTMGNPDDRGFKRQFFSQARELPVDKPGRILLPREVRELAGIESEAILLGVDDHVEVWSPANWAEEFARSQEKYSTAAGGIFRA